MDKPMIGVLALIDYARESYWMLPGYMQGIMEAGGVPVMLPLTDDAETIRQLVETFDGFLLTGGQDVSPELYGAGRLEVCGETSDIRDRMEVRLFRQAYERDRPMLGICRGIQFVNAVMGGTLWQDLPSQRPCSVEHHQSPPYDEPVHSVTVIEGSPLDKLLDGMADGIYVDDTAETAAVTGAAEADGADAAMDGAVEYAAAKAAVKADEGEETETAVKADIAVEADMAEATFETFENADVTEAAGKAEMAAMTATAEAAVTGARSERMFREKKPDEMPALVNPREMCGEEKLYDDGADNDLSVLVLHAKRRLMVNSYHHQAVRETAPGLSVMAVSEDGLVEGVWDSSRRFLWAVQWHPEFSFRKDESSLRIFRAFVEACEGLRRHV